MTGAQARAKTLLKRLGAGVRRALNKPAVDRERPPVSRREQGPPLDAQMRRLGEAGLPLSEGLDRDDLLEWGPESTYRADPWRLILMTYASPADHRDDRPFCPCAGMIDTECADHPRACADLVRDLARIASLQSELHDVAIDMDRGAGQFSYRLGHHHRQLVPHPDGDWLDPEILDRMVSDFDARLPSGTHLWMMENGQSLAIFRLPDTEAAGLNALRPGLLRRLASGALDSRKPFCHDPAQERPAHA
ncbi:hypothetical protein ACN2XU_10160 [Primorskyibacter sp. 2E107]|uniref:hypothetical protein n=1 Tax=Primorskyibacter sp. 2E107 TaxID=3403458 RepID=UPI003AF9FFCA